jgi:hypothetical protein
VHRLKRGLLALFLVLGMMVQSGSAEATVQTGLGEAIVIGVAVVGVGAVLNLTSIVASSVYLGMKKRSALGWQVFGHTVGGLTLGVALVYAARSPTTDLFAVVGIGATTLTLSILAGTLNKPKTKPAVALSPVLIQDMQGHVTPGLGLSVLAF